MQFEFRIYGLILKASSGSDVCFPSTSNKILSDTVLANSHIPTLHPAVTEF